MAMMGGGRGTDTGSISGLSTILDLVKDSDAVQARIAEITAAEQAFDDKKTEIAVIQNQLDRRAEQLDAQAAKLDADRAEHARERSVLLGEVATAKTAAEADLANQKAQLAAEKAAIDTQWIDCRARLAFVQSQESALASKNAAFDSAVAAKQAEFDARAAALDRTKSDLSVLFETYRAKDTALNSAKADLDRRGNALDQRELDIENAEADLKAREADFADRQNQLRKILG